MDFDAQSGAKELDGQGSAYPWKSQSSELYPEVTQMETERGPTRMVVPSLTENGNQVNWRSFQQYQSENEFNGFGIGFQPSFDSSNNQLMQSPGFQDRRSSAGFYSDYDFPGLSNQASPGYLDDPLDEQFGPKLVLDDNGGTSSADAVSSAVSTSNMPWNPPHDGKYRGDAQLLSPELTGTSSPASGTGEHAFTAPALIANPQPNFGPRPTTLTPPAVPLPSHPYGIIQQYSPAASVSPANPQAALLPDSAAQMASSYHVGSYGDTPIPKEQFPRVSESQFIALDTSEAEAGQSTDSVSKDRRVHKRPLAAPEQTRSLAADTVERQDDGSWIPNKSTGQSGLAPESRSHISNAVIPTIEEQEQQRLLDDRNADVEEWLSNNPIEKSTEDAQSQLIIPTKGNVHHRRSKSTGDPFSSNDNALIDDSHVPGPGVNIQEQSDLEEDADGSSVSSERNGSPAVQLHDPLPAEGSPSTPSHASQAPSGRYNARPWNDGPRDSTYSSERYQPTTSNAAMTKFYQRARDLETASRSATIGSRRRSDSDLESILSFRLGTAQATTRTSLAKPKAETDKPSGIFATIMSRRPSSNILKRKGTNAMSSNQHQSRPENRLYVSDPKLQATKTNGTARLPRSPRIDTSFGGNRSPYEPSSAISSSSLAPWTQAKNVIRRNRSKSDISRTLGLKDLMTQHGGPPMLKLASPGNDMEHLQSSLALDQEDDDDVDTGKCGAVPPTNSVAMNMEVHFERIVPTLEGFQSHALSLNPRLAPYLADRIATEQQRRYKKLLSTRADHAKAVKARRCASGERCFGLGGTPKLLPLRTNNKNSATITAGFQVLSSPTSEDNADKASHNDGSIVPAQFPSGIPIPPVSRLPAEFECPLCFQVKQFMKPSDWTKHVHEDVSPFTCTFEICAETKSFKRKADWVRHENERHRRLESWICNFPDCSHSCHRKDNFVQHLVREHGLPEPKQRTSKSTSEAVRTGPLLLMDVEYKDIWALIDTCRKDTTKNADEEPCRFCGNICGSWKKLTVHLAKHLEQISLPVLGLLQQSRGGLDQALMANTTGQGHGLPQQIDFRQRAPVVPAENWMRHGMSTAENEFPLHVEAKADVGLAAQPAFVPSSHSPCTYPPVYFDHHNPATSDAQSFLHGQSPIYPGNGMNANTAQHYPSPQLQTSYSHPSSDQRSGAFPITNTTSIGDTQQLFVSSPLDTSEFGSRAFADHHTHSSTYPGR